MTFRPMLAYNKTPSLDELHYPLLASPKLDGIRCVMANGIPMTRSMKRVPNRFITEYLKKLKMHGLDGELMVAGDFNDVQSQVMSHDGEPDFVFHVFDDFSLDSAPFAARLASAKEKVEKLNDPRVRLVEHVTIVDKEMLQVMWDHWVGEGHEGGMARSILGPYKQGRSTLNQGYLIKLKVWHDAEAKVIGTDEQMHNENEAELGELGQTKRSKSVHGLVPADTLGALRVVYAGKEFGVGTGFTDEMRKELWEKKETLIGKTITFKYLNLSSYGVPRHPVFKGFRYE